MKKLRIGIIGCGRISVMHFEAAVALEEAELVACADIVPERADEAAKTYGAHSRYRRPRRPYRPILQMRSTWWHRP